MRANVLARLVIPAAVLLLAGAGGATTATLPGGTSLGVDVTYPTEGAVLPEATAYTVAGHATIGTAAPVASTFLITAIDVSGSTSASVSTSACGNVNTVHDTASNTVLDCELAAARALNTAAVSQGTVALAALVGFSGGSGHDTAAAESAARLDVGPAGGIQGSVPPATDTNGNAIRDIEDVLASAFNRSVSSTFGLPAGADYVGFSRFSLFDFYGNTNYWAAVTQIRNLAATAPPGLTKIAVLLSDGESTKGGPGGVTVSAALTGITGIKIYTFAIGNSASCAGSPATDYGTLQQIADATGATCTHITNPAQAIDAVPDAIGSKLSAFGVSNDGGATFAVPAAIAPVPPATLVAGAVAGPATVNLAQGYPAVNATPGPKTLCLRATGTDGGGSQALTDCVNVTIKARPVVSAGADGAVPEGTAFALAGSASDGSLGWSSTGGTGTCTFADASVAATSVTCDDNGSYTLTLTADDGVNPSQSSSAMLTVTNVAPAVTLTLSPGPHPLAGTVTASAAVTDPGTADTYTCEIDWGDATVTSACSGSHVYAAGGPYTVTATATDDDGDSGSDAQSLTVDAPPLVAAGGDRLGVEGGLVFLGGSVTDDGATTKTWTAAPGAGVDAGASCSFGSPSSAATTVTCTDDGTWTLTLRADDGVNPPVSDSLELSLANAAPTIAITSPPAGASPLAVSLSAAVDDPGSNDVLSCTIDWGDSSSSAGTVAGGVCSATHTYAAGTPSATLSATVSDDDGASDSASRTLDFNRPPSCAGVSSSLTTLWPPNHAMRLVVLRGATDPDGDPLTYTIVSVRQDEPLDGAGDGSTARDARLASGGSVWLRAERSGRGDGRVYTIAYRVSDGQASCTGSVRVSVPHSVNKAAVLTPGPGFNSLG